MLAYYIQIKRGESKTNLRLGREKIFRKPERDWRRTAGGASFCFNGKGEKADNFVVA
jgi:hypothetical protein